jgi:hypothetical protein
MPWPVHPTGFFGARGDSDTYRIERSLRFNSADSAYLNRTFSGTPTTYTISFWLKRAKISTQMEILTSRAAGVYGAFYMELGSSDIITVGLSGSLFSTTAVFRDTSSWYHVVLSVSPNSTAILYVNGTQVASGVTGASPSLFSSSGTNTIGRYGDSASFYFDGYITEFYYIDGQKLTPSSFGETDPYTGRWKAKAYSGTYGTNGVYLNFSDNSGTTSTTLGKDSSGNGNNWTPNNFSVTAGTGNDSLVDSPTNYGVGTGTVGNFCTWNPLINGDSAANGNLDVTNDTARGNHELMKYDAYWEVTSTGGTCLAGIISTAETSTITVGSAKTFGFKLSEAGVFEYANITDGSSFTSQATATTPPFPYASTGAAITASLNCGQRAFAGTLPTGYKPICTTSLDQPTIQKPNKYMDALAYTGTGASNSISSLGFSPDLVWIKNRGTTTNHAIYDTTRGTQAQLSSNTTGDEVTSSTGLTSFDANGFTIGTSTLVNTNGTQYVAWGWDESVQAGMDIVSYTGNGANRTISHNLGVVPKMIIVKARTTAGADQGWPVWHTSIANTTYLGLNSTSATATGADYWNSTSPTSSVFSVGTNAAVNANNDTYISYLFSEIEGYSKFGSYAGNASADGPFAWCGFRPRWVMIKNATSGGFWAILDTERNLTNMVTTGLRADSSGADLAGFDMDILSSGFKIRDSETGLNGSGNTIIFAAFAESPFKYARAR